MSAALEEVVTEAPAVEAIPKRAMTLGAGTSLVVLGLLIVAPLMVKNFVIFQMTMLLIYGLAVLALNTTDTLEVQFACGRLGAAFVPLNTRLVVPELEYIVDDAAPKAIVHDDDLEIDVFLRRQGVQAPVNARGAVE